MGTGPLMSPAMWIPYIRFLLHAKGRHGLHSPFAYGFVENVLRGGPVPGSLSTTSSASTFPASTSSASTSQAFGARDFQHLVRIISYWKPRKIRLFPEVMKVGSALERLFPAVPISKAESEIQPVTPVLWVGKVDLTSAGKQPVFEELIFKDLPICKEQAIVLFDTSTSRSHRELAADLLLKSVQPMGIDFWSGIFLASGSQFRVRQRFALKPFFYAGRI